MTRTIQQKIDKLREKISRLVQQYGSKSSILDQRNAFRLSGDIKEAKRLYNIYQTIRRNEQKLNSLESQLQEDEETQSDTDGDNTPINICANCARRQSPYLTENTPQDSIYHLEFIYQPSNIISSHRKFKTVSAGNRNIIQHCLCKDCAIHLTHEDTDVANLPDFTWAAFMWINILSNRDIHTKYGSKIWQFIPNKWRYWWIDSLIESFPNTFFEITIDNPISMIDDRSLDMEEWNHQVETLTLQDLANVCNTLLLSTVSCP